MSAQASSIAWGDPVRVWLRGQTGRMAAGRGAHTGGVDLRYPRR